MTLQVEAAEAICSALYQLPFSEFLGEADHDGARRMWFHLGEKPKDMRVTVIRPDQKEEVLVKAEWRNYFADGREPLRGEQTFSISTYATTKDMLAPATTEAVVKVLELYRDVLAEEGVAGKISDLNPATDEPGTNEE